MSYVQIFARAALFAVLPLAGGDVGIGVSFKSNEGSIFLPYQVSERFRVEGNLQHRRMQSESRGPWEGRSNATDRSTSIGVGLMWLRPVGQGSTLYAGPRLSYLNRSFKNTMVSQDPALPREVSYKTSASGLSVAPTLGYEYFPIKHLSVGGEVAVSYVKLDGGVAWSNAAEAPMRSTSTETTSSLIVRMYF